MAIQRDDDKRTAACPSCGANLRFRGATSVVAVCAYCRATVVREGVALADIGRQADLLPDASPLQLGTEGGHRGQRFTVVGRIQYRYGAGVWNEWHVLFGGGKGAWLSDANGEYTIAYLSPPAGVPAFDALRPGAEISLAGDRYTVMDLETAEVVAGEGELPFRFQSGWKALVADLRGEGARFATLDYSEDPPHVYLGERLPFDTFRFQGLRDPDRYVEPRARAIAFKCGGCGAPLEKKVATTEVIACGSCGTVNDVTGTAGEVVQKSRANELRGKASLPLGARGRLQGADYEIVGYLRKRITVDGTDYEWAEYLLHHFTQGYLWLGEYEGHFSVIRAAADVPKVKKAGPRKGQPVIRYLGRDFRHFQRSQPEVVHLEGEFNWRVKRGDRCRADDYVAPPLMLSSEATGNEITWSLGEYIEPGALWKAFGREDAPPPRRGVGPNQPAPLEGRTGRYWLAFFGFLAIGVALHWAMSLLHHASPVAPVSFGARAGEEVRTVSPVFTLGGVRGPLLLHVDVPSGDAAWHVALRLVDADSGRAWDLSGPVGAMPFRSGAPARPIDAASIEDVPPGRYTLAVVASAQAPPGRTAAANPLAGEVSLGRGEPTGFNLVFLALALVLWPVAASMRVSAFEKRRWAESDYPPEAADTSGTDD